MKYLCMLYTDPENPVVLSDKEEAVLINQQLDYVDELRRANLLVATQALQPASVATTVLLRQGKKTVTDGPFAETKEQFTGFYLIDVKDLNEAIRVAEKIPSLRYGPVEIRPVRELERS